MHALRDVTLQFPSMEFAAVMGPSGSGKSTLMHCLAALDLPTSGEVYLGDTEVTSLSHRQRAHLRRDRIGFVFQAFNLIPTLEARENITLPQQLAGRRVDRGWLGRIVEQVGLGDRLHHRPAELSGGQQQRVAVARALVGRPEIIFADEPTGNLDTRAGHEVLELLRAAVDSYGQTLVMVTHDPIAAAYADRVVFLNDGQIVDDFYGPTPDRVLDRLKHLDDLYAGDQHQSPSFWPGFDADHLDQDPGLPTRAPPHAYEQGRQDELDTAPPPSWAGGPQHARRPGSAERTSRHPTSALRKSSTRVDQLRSRWRDDPGQRWRDDADQRWWSPDPASPPPAAAPVLPPPFTDEAHIQRWLQEERQRPPVQPPGQDSRHGEDEAVNQRLQAAIHDLWGEADRGPTPRDDRSFGVQTPPAEPASLDEAQAEEEWLPVLEVDTGQVGTGPVETGRVEPQPWVPPAAAWQDAAAKPRSQDEQPAPPPGGLTEHGEEARSWAQRWLENRRAEQARRGESGFWQRLPSAGESSEQRLGEPDSQEVREESAPELTSWRRDDPRRQDDPPAQVIPLRVLPELRDIEDQDDLTVPPPAAHGQSDDATVPPPSRAKGDDHTVPPPASAKHPPSPPAVPAANRHVNTGTRITAQQLLERVRAKAALAKPAPLTAEPAPGRQATEGNGSRALNGSGPRVEPVQEDDGFLPPAVGGPGSAESSWTGHGRRWG